MASLQVPLTYNLIIMHLNMVSFEGFAGSSTSVADIYIIYHTRPQIEQIICSTIM